VPQVIDIQRLLGAVFLSKAAFGAPIDHAGRLLERLVHKVVHCAIDTPKIVATTADVRKVTPASTPFRTTPTARHN